MFLKCVDPDQLEKMKKSYGMAQNNSHVPKYFHFKKIRRVLEATLESSGPTGFINSEFKHLELGLF